MQDKRIYIFQTPTTTPTDGHFLVSNLTNFHLSNTQIPDGRGKSPPPPLTNQCVLTQKREKVTTDWHSCETFWHGDMEHSLIIIRDKC